MYRASFLGIGMCDKRKMKNLKRSYLFNQKSKQASAPVARERRLLKI